MEKQNIQAKEVYLGAPLLQLYDSVLNLHGKNNEIRKNNFTQPQSIKFGLWKNVTLANVDINANWKNHL